MYNNSNNSNTVNLECIMSADRVNPGAAQIQKLMKPDRRPLARGGMSIAVPGFFIF